MFKICLAFIALLVSQNLNAHARWTLNGSVVPRSTNSGIKTGPCGGIARTGTPKVFQPGSTITVQWEETINHPGRFEIYFSPANDANFVLLRTVVDTQNGGLNTASITLPTAPCAACTLQLIQVMTEDPNNPSLYYSCADIQLTGTATVPPATPPIAPPASCK